MKLFVGVASLALACAAGAQSFSVVPNANESTAGNGGFLFMVTTPRTYQYVIQASQLTNLVGQNINGLQWRLLASASTNWPPVNAVFNSFDVYIGAGVEPAARSLTFANNYTGTPTQVRSGSLTITAGSFPATGTPRDWGPVISFNDYLYTGGNLTIEMRHSGMTGNTTTASFEANTSSAPGYLTQYAAVWQGTAAPTTGSQGNFFVTRLSATPVPEPGSLLALSLGAGFFMRRRARK